MIHDSFLEQIEPAARKQELQEKLMAKLPKGWNGHELMTAIFPPTRWAVKGLIPTGAILLSGTFKIGKSWMMLQLTDCVSRGKSFLGHETNPGAVLYLALEDGPARIQRRAGTMGIALAENVHIFNAWLPGNDGLQSLDAWLENHPVRLIIIDTLSRWQDDFHGSDIWMRDTKRIADLKAIADLLDSTVLIVHHRSKATRDDIHQSVAGTNALQGAADGSLILDKKRSENTARLSILGRDIPEAELAIEFIPEYCTWKALDYDPSEMALNQDQQCILEALREMGGTGKPGQVAARLGKERSSIGHTMAKMASEGVLTSIAYGTYSTIKPIPSVPTVPTSSGLGVETGNTGNTGNSITGGLYENGHEIESLL